MYEYGISDFSLPTVGEAHPRGGWAWVGLFLILLVCCMVTYDLKCRVVIDEATRADYRNGPHLPGLHPAS